MRGLRCYALYVAALCACTDEIAEMAEDRVAPIDWSTFREPAPTDPNALRMRAILANANRYALTTWSADRGFETEGDYDLGGNDEDQIRPVASEAFALAVALQL